MPKAEKAKKVSYFGMKSEADAYHWDELVKEKETYWDGVRNYQARNVMKDMVVGDIVFFYHSVKEKRFVGVARVTKEHYQDPTTDDTKWVAVDIEAVKPLKKFLDLKTVKADKAFADMALVKQARLSVFHMTPKHAARILKLCETTL